MVAAADLSPKPSVPPRVLIVDDDELVLRSLSRALSVAGMNVTAISDPCQAMSAVTAETFDAVLCDIRMPQMSGLTLAQYVRSAYPDLPIMLMTGNPQLESAIECVHIGVQEYLPKPIDASKLRAAVSRAVNIHRLARARREAAMVVEEAPRSMNAGLGKALDRALASMTVAFQPIVDVSQRSIYGYEALLRSSEPELPNPPAVIAAAEQLGRTGEVGAIVRSIASTAFLAAPADALLFLNILPQDLMDDVLYDTSSRLGKLANRIVLEMTERAELGRVKDALPRIERLRALGYRIAVDDLGAGYAGLSSFTALEPELTKLDMSLVRGAHASGVKMRVLGSIVSLCNDLGGRVVAEGIETKEDRDALRSLGCELMQGYLFAKPGPAFPDVKF